MPPKIGDVVTYIMAEYDNHWAHGAGLLDPAAVAPGTQIAAIICRVHPDGAVNLRIVNDGHGDFPWIENIRHGDQPGQWFA